jgi:hypothetical protein
VKVVAAGGLYEKYDPKKDKDNVLGGQETISFNNPKPVRSHQRGRHSKKLQMQVERSEIPVGGSASFDKLTALSRVEGQVTRSKH